MVTADQRKHPRHLLVGRQAPGDFHLLTPEAMHSVRVIRDISASGIRVVLDVAVAKRSVAVEYSEPNVKLTTQGRVAWCAEQPDESEDADHFMVGVELFSPFLFMVLTGVY